MPPSGQQWSGIVLLLERMLPFDETAHRLIKAGKPGWRPVALKPIAMTRQRPPSITKSQTPRDATDDNTSIVPSPVPARKGIRHGPERPPFLTGGKQLLRRAPLYPTPFGKVNQPPIPPGNGKMRPALGFKEEAFRFQPEGD